MSVAHIWKLQENTATMCKMAAKLSGYAVRGSGYVQPGKLKRLSFPGAGCKISGWNGGDSRILDVIHPGGKWRQPDVMAARSPIRICFPDEKDPRSAALRWCARTPCPDDSISYPDSFSLLCHGFQRTLLNLGLLW